MAPVFVRDLQPALTVALAPSKNKTAVIVNFGGVFVVHARYCSVVVV